jgi:hypothetical protein
VAEELVVGVFDDEGKAWDAVVSAKEVAAQRKSGILAWTRRVTLEEAPKFTA